LKFNDKVFRVEIDTSARFNSPWKQTNTLTGKGIGTWELELLPESLADTVQYYWRSVFEDELSNDPVPWANSSFTYIANTSEGFGQTEFDQFQDLTLSSLSREEISKNWIFAGTETTIDVTTFGDQHPNGGNPSAMTVEIDGADIFSRPCATNSANLLAFDKDNGRPYVILRTEGELIDIRDPLSCGRRPQVINRITDAPVSYTHLRAHET